MEMVDTRQHRPLHGCNSRKSPDYVRMDAKWGPDCLYQGSLERKQGCPCETPLIPQKITRLIVHQLLDVAKGLDYIHSCGVIHGDIKGVNFSSSPNLVVSLMYAYSRILWWIIVAARG